MNLTWLYVGALFAIASRLLRLPRAVAALFYLVGLGFLWQPLTQPVVMIAADVVKLTAPWSEMRPPGRRPVSKFEVSNLNQQDVPMQIAPWMHQVRESWLRGEVPLWNASAGTGYPLLANGQSTPLAPLRLLTLPLSLDRAMAAECALKLLLAMSFMYLFCRKRYSSAASILGALSYGLSTWMTVWLQFPIAGAAAFLPGVMLAVDGLLESATRRRFLAATLVFAATVFSGHPETTYQIGLFAAAFGFWVALVERREPRKLLAVAGASVVAALLSAPFLVPFAESVVRSDRLAHIRDVPTITKSPFPPMESAAMMLQPSFFGQLPIERPWGAAVSDSICGFAGVLAIAACVAIPIQIVRRRRWRDRETLYVLAFVFCLGVVLHWSGISEAFHAIAGLAPTVRMRFGVCWFASILAAAVVDWSREDARWPLLAGVLAVAAAMLALVLTPFPTPSHRVSAVLSLLPSIMVLAAIALLPLRRPAAIAVVASLIVFELWAPVSRWNPALLRRDFYPSTPLIATLQRLRAADREPFRIVGIGSQIYPNTGAMYGFDDARVHDPLAPRRYLDLLHGAIGWNPTSYYEKWRDTDTALLDLFNVKYVVTEPGRELAEPRYASLYSGPDGRIYENRQVLPLFFPVRNILPGGDPAHHADWRYTALVNRLPLRHRAALAAPWAGPDTRVQVTRRAPDRYRLQIDAPRTTLIASSITMWPGWRAGHFTVIEVNGLFVGFIVPAGRHVVDVAYLPLSFYASAVVALLTFLTLIVINRPRRVSAARATPPQNDSGT